MFHKFNILSYKYKDVYIVVATTESTKLLGKFISLSYIKCKQFTTINVEIFFSIYIIYNSSTISNLKHIGITA